MKFKNLRKSSLTFLTGLIIGLGLAPLADKTPRQVIVSPISPTLAETKGFILPASENQVLGLQANKDEVEKPKAQKPKKSKFANLIPTPVPTPGVSKETPGVTDVKTETVSQADQSNYSGRITIAAVGDSMTDLMGPNLPYLKTELKKYYPKADLNLLNYGVGGDNIENGSARIRGEYNYQGRHYPTLTSIEPDIIVIESFAYNPFSNGENELDRHWQDLANLVDYIKNNTKVKIIIMATIAPTKEFFGQGPAGVNWPKDLAFRQAEKINQYLDNTVRFAKSANLPLVDVYHQTLLSNGEGNLDYINPGDHIHQNVAGNELIAKLLAEAIKNNL